MGADRCRLAQLHRPHGAAVSLGGGDASGRTAPPRSRSPRSRRR
jgi:hypothetical protein